MANKKTSCAWVARIPGTDEVSTLFRELTDIVANRPLSNYVYAYYLTGGIADAMDSAGYKRNAQGQHKANDVYRFFEVNKMKSLLGIPEQSKAEGFTDKSGNLIDFEAVDAYSKAQQFNNDNKGRVAYVVSNGDKFNIIIDDRDSRTQVRDYEVNRDLLLWESLRDNFGRLGKNIDEIAKINPRLINPGSIKDFMKNLKAIVRTPNDGISVKDIELLLTLESDVSVVDNILKRGWGTVEETAQKMYDILHGSGTPGNVALVNNALSSARKALEPQRVTISNELKNVDDSYKSVSTSYEIQQTLRDLDKKYGIETDIYLRKSDKILKVSEAMADAVMSLERQIRNIETTKGKTAKSEELKTIQTQLLAELKAKQNSKGLVDFLNTSVKYLNQIQNIFQNIPNTATGLEHARNLSDAVAQATNLQRAYYSLVNALAKIDKLVNDVSLTAEDKTTIRDLAQSLKEDFDAQNSKIKELSREAMIEVGSSFIGEHNSLYGKDLSTIIDMLEADASYMDYFYSVGRVSNTFVSLFGAVVRDVQLERDGKLLDISNEIKRTTNKLYKSGSDSDFMYDEKGRIVSPYDWDEFYKQRSKYAGKLKLAGFKYNSLDFEIEMNKWEEANTYEIEVDHINHRFERVPRYTLSSDFQEGWTAAQKEYYDEMMELKGRMGTLLPKYAQHQYIAPQRRASWDQFVKDLLLKRKSFRDVVKGLTKLTLLWKLKEDDTNFRRNGVYFENEEMVASTSGYDNTILRQIPVFYIKKVDENDLSHDFSAAMQSLASTALNYEAMNSIKNLADLMVDYANDESILDRDAEGNPRVDFSAKSSGIRVASMLHKKAKTDRTTAMLESFVQKEVYGLESKEAGIWGVITSNLIGLTSFRGLSTNVLGALTNRSVGIIQAIIRASGGQYFNFKDLARAYAILTGEQGLSTKGAILGGVVAGAPGALVGLAAGTAVGIKGMSGKLVDIVTGNKENKDTLISEFFDTAQETFAKLSNTRYHSTAFGRLFGSVESTAMYQRGEYWIHMLNTYALLSHEKVIHYNPTTGQREKVSVLDVLKKGKSKNGVAELALEDGVFRMDGKKIEGMSDDYFKALKRRLRYINQQCHGSMNKEDKGLIHQWMLGKLAMNFRQWMVEHYSSRYRGLHWDESVRDVDFSNFYQNTKVLLDGKEVSLFDALEMVDNGLGDGSFHYEIKSNATTKSGDALTDTIINTLLEEYAEDAGWKRGFKTDTFLVLKELIEFYKDGNRLSDTATLFWDNLSETQKADVRQTLGEYFMLLALSGLSSALGDPKDNSNFYFRVWLYTVKRCLFDERATLIPGLFLEGKTIMNKPIAAAETVNGLMYPILAPFLSPEDLTTRIERGRHKGETRYWNNIVKYTLPINIHKVDQLLHLDEDASIFNTFDNQLTR